MDALTIRTYDQWEETALVLQQILQMMGKTKLAYLEPQPQWGHILLDFTAGGFSTGLILEGPLGESSFSIELSLRDRRVQATRIDGRESGFTLRSGASISTYYQEFMQMLNEVLWETEIYTVPQEMALTTPFEKNNAPCDFDFVAAFDFLSLCVFAYKGIYRFLAPFRYKKFLPHFFWGTFDTTGALFSGKESPWPYKGFIEAGAFDEQLMEFGFWPGDSMVKDPSFFVLAYPFPTRDYRQVSLGPKGAVFSAEKSEFFLPVKDLLACNDPAAGLQEFFMTCYRLIVEDEKWPRALGEKPLLYGKGSRKAPQAG